MIRDNQKIVWIALCVSFVHLTLALASIWFFQPLQAVKVKGRLQVNTVALKVIKEAPPIAETTGRFKENEKNSDGVSSVMISEKKEGRISEDVSKKKEGVRARPEPVKPLNSIPQKQNLKKTPLKKSPPSPLPKNADSSPRENISCQKEPLKGFTEKERMLQKAREHHVALEQAKKSLGSASRKESLSLKDINEVRYICVRHGEGRGTKDAGYFGVLGEKLKIELKLPENGDVSLKLTLNNRGDVASLEILSTTSEKNRRYVEVSLKALKFPPFGVNFPGEKQHTFTIKLAS